jgi:ribonuclease R
LAKRRSSRTAAKPSGLPRQEEILEFLRTATGKVGKREIARAFGIKGAARIELKRVLSAMAATGAIAKERGHIAEPQHLKPVSVLEVAGSDADGELVARPVPWDEAALGPAPRVLVEPGPAGGRAAAAPAPPGIGERILARITPTGETGRASYPYSARVIRRLGREGRRILGIFRRRRQAPSRIVPVDRKVRSEVEVLAGDELKAEHGELVAAEIIQDRGRGLLRARVSERLGRIGDQRNISLIAIHEHGIPDRFSPAAVAAAAALAPVGLAERGDRRGLPLVTIDPPDARDHDDAVLACADDEPANAGGFRILVAIADVAHYVRSGSALDRDARERGNSVYFPDRVVPMLPERLSSDLCSLKARAERPALLCTMTFDKAGRKLRHRFDRVRMRSAARLTYEQAQAAIDGRPDAATRPLIAPVLEPLWAAYRVLAAARRRRGPLELDLPERKLILDAHGLVERVVSPERLDAHRLVEEFMIQANVAAAETLEKERQPLLYRIHEPPAQEKVAALAEFLDTLGLKLAKGQALRPKHFNAILEQVRGRDYEHLVNEVVLRTQAQAVYSPENRGHFGLHLRRYAHFTSPIRRYADLIVHRALIAALGLGGDGLSDGDTGRLHATAELISMTERRAMAAERDTVDRLIAAHLADRVGSVFSGRIAGLAPAGLFVKLAETGADGFIPAATLGDEYFFHHAASHALIGEQSGVSYRLGDPVEVRLLEVTPLSGGLRFEMLSDGRPGKPPARRGTAPRGAPRRPHRGRR